MITRASLFVCVLTICSAALAAPAPSSGFAGRGQQASRLFTLDKGLAVFTMKHDGRSNFIVNLLDDRGNIVAFLTNVIGPFDGSKAIRIPRSGSYLLDINADGKWEIGFQSPKGTAGQ